MMLLIICRHCSLAVMKALERIANNITQTSDKRDFLLHLLEMFVQMGLQVRQLSEKAHRKVGLFFPPSVRDVCSDRNAS